MVEKIGLIKNPLTIIAIFAAIAEISGTVVLPFIAAENQSTYVWFLIVFPILLVVLFFLTLNINHRVLYAPSDYQNEENFLHSLPRATFAEKVLKIQAELAESAAAPALEPEVERNRPQVPEVLSTAPPLHRISNTSQAKMLVEEFVFRKLSREFSSEIQREIKLDSLGAPYIFDGIVHDKGITTFIEVKHLQRSLMSGMRLRETFARIQESAKLLPIDQATNFRVLLAMVCEDVTFSQDSISAQIDKYRREFPFPIEVRFYNLSELEREFNIGS